MCNCLFNDHSTHSYVVLRTRRSTDPPTLLSLCRTPLDDRFHTQFSFSCFSDNEIGASPHLKSFAAGTSDAELFDRCCASASTVRVSWIFTIENGIAVLKSVESRPNGLPMQETNTGQGNRREESCFHAVVVHSCRVGASIMITRSR